MQHARRLASVAVIAVLGSTALSGCRSQPGVAAYVGDREITEDQVTAVVDDAKGRVVEGGDAKAPTRSQVVSTLVLGDVCRRLAAEKGFQPQGEAPPEQLAQQLGVPADSRYVEQTSELYACLSGVPAGQPVAPTQEELADLVERGRAAGVIPPDVSVADAGAQLDGDQLRSALATRNALAGAVADDHVSINPRYRQLAFPVLRFSDNAAAVGVPIGEGAPDTVVDAR